MQGCVLCPDSRSLKGEIVAVGAQSTKQPPVLQFLALLVFVVLLSAAQPVKADPANSLVDESLLSALYSNYGQAAYVRGLNLSQLLERLRGAGTLTKLNEVNRFFNRFSYQSDLALWKERDHWATPLEFLGKHGGDCEDFVISKYFALRSLGLSDATLSIIYAKSTSGGSPHMVLSYQGTPDSVPLILDEHGTDMSPATQYKEWIPVFGFNESSIFLAQASFAPGQALRSDKVLNSKWDNMLAAVKKREGHLRIAGHSQPRFGG